MSSWRPSDELNHLPHTPSQWPPSNAITYPAVFNNETYVYPNGVLPKANRLPSATLLPMNMSKPSAEEPNPYSKRTRCYSTQGTLFLFLLGDSYEVLAEEKWISMWLSGLLADRTKWHEFRSKRHHKSITSCKCYVGHPPLKLGQLC